jgi:hypothetical protein
MDYAIGAARRLRVFKHIARTVASSPQKALTRRWEMISRRSIDLMLDLIENRVACMQVIDREDHRQLAIMTQARRELLALRDRSAGAISRVAGAASGAAAAVAAGSVGGDIATLTQVAIAAAPRAPAATTATAAAA